MVLLQKKTCKPAVIMQQVSIYNSFVMVKMLGLGLTVYSYYCSQSATKVNGFY